MRPLYALHHLPRRLSKLRIHADAKGQHDGQPAARAVEAITQRYWNRVPWTQRAKIYVGLKRMRAREACASGLARLGEGNVRGGWSALGSALVLYPFVLGTPAAWRLLARLVLPLALRRRWLHAP
jgi:hypothetical protein